jgi:hypothetical protein
MRFSLASCCSTAAALAIVVSASFAHAQTAVPAPAAVASAPYVKGQRHPHGMKALDTNKDRLISRTEAAARPKLAQNFDAIDTNKDGQLSKDEMKAFRAARHAARKPTSQPGAQPAPLTAR